MVSKFVIFLQLIYCSNLGFCVICKNKSWFAWCKIHGTIKDEFIVKGIIFILNIYAMYMAHNAHSIVWIVQLIANKHIQLTKKNITKGVHPNIFIHIKDIDIHGHVM
jgi:hypothetical protein